MIDLPKPAVPYDWPHLCNLYVQSEQPISLVDLAQQTGAPLRSLQRHSADERWVAQRREYHSAVASKARALAIEETAQQRVGSREAVRVGIDLLGKQLQNMAAALEGKDWKSEDPKDIARASASIATALEKVGRLERVIEGEPDSIARIDLATLLADLRSE